MPCGALEIYSVLPRFTGFFYSQCCIGAPRISWSTDGDDHPKKKCQGCRVFQGSDTPQGRRRADSLRVQDVHPARPCAGMVAVPRSRDRGGSGDWPADQRSRYLKQILQDYVSDAKGVVAWGRSKTADIARLQKAKLAHRDARHLRAIDFVE